MLGFLWFFVSSRIALLLTLIVLACIGVGAYYIYKNVKEFNFKKLNVFKL